MLKDAWDDYARHAWGENELKPISQTGQSGGIFGDTKIGATIVDALDTLYIMELSKEYDAGRAWVAEHLDFDTVVSGLNLKSRTVSENQDLRPGSERVRFRNEYSIHGWTAHGLCTHGG